MSVRSFFDTNVLIYTDDHDAPEKQARALELLERARLDGSGAVSTQVLQEYFVVATRKLGVPAGVTRRQLELRSRVPAQPDFLVDINMSMRYSQIHENDCSAER